MGILDIFEQFRDTIFLKEDSSLQKIVIELENLLEKEPKNEQLQQELYIAKKGLKGEDEIAYQLKKANIGMYVLRDINIEYEDLKAQIDFIVVTPWCCYFIECKNLIGNITIDERGNFIREYTYNGNTIKKGMESPYRQVCAQREVYKKIWIKIQGKFKTFLYERNFEELHRVLVVASNGENILNTEKAPIDIKYEVVKSDGLIRKLEYDRNHSDKSLWDNRKRTEEWANHFLKLNVNKETESKDLLSKEKVENQISNNEISNLKDIEIKNKTDFEKVANLLEYRYAKTYTNFAPHEYAVENEEGEKLEIIRKLNKFIQENYDEIEIFAKKEYKVLFVGKHKYWSMGKWDETNILNRNWDFKNEDGTTNTSITYSYLGK